jgi:hypothetical protein
MESPPEITGPFNLGNPVEHTVKDIAQIIIARTGSTSEIEYHPLPQDDPKRRRPLVSLAREVLGWSPRINLDEGLHATINYFSLRIAADEALPVAVGVKERVADRRQVRTAGKRGSAMRGRPVMQP